MPTLIETPVTLLVIDDDPGTLAIVGPVAASLGFMVEYRHAGTPLTESRASVGAEVAILDVPTPDERGLDAFRRLRERDPSCEIILITNHASVDMAVIAVKSGASDYLVRPLGAMRVSDALTTARENVRRERAAGTIQRDDRRRQGKRLVRRNRLLSDTMLESLPGIVYFYDDQGRFLRWNDNFVTVSGYSSEEIARMHPLDFFAGDDKRRVGQRIAEVFENGHSSIEASFVGKDGRATPYFFTGRSVVVDGSAYLVGMGIDISERTQANIRVADSERKYRELVECANSIILRWRADGHITFLNEFGLQFFGYSAAEILDRHVVGTIVPPFESSGRDLALLMERIRAAPAAFERSVNENIRRNGEVVSIAWTNRIERDTDGEVAEILSVGTDITEQRHAEEALRASEGRYRTLFEYAPDGIVLANRDARFIDANTSMCQMLGYSHGELIGRQAADIVTEAETPYIEPALHLIATTSHYHREWQLRRKDGSVFPAEVIAKAMPDGNLIGMIRDVSERNGAIDALRIAEERMRFALQNAHVGIWDTDLTTGVVRWSEALESQYGLLPGTFAGTFEAFVAQVHPEDRAAVRDAVANAMATGGDFSILNRSIRPDGSVRWLSGTGRVLLDEHGEPVRSVGISLDVTERRALEAQDQQAQKMEAIGHLAGGVAHDFNNLLTAILGYCELLLTDLDPIDPRHADIGEIQKAGTRAVGLTRQLLAFSRRQLIQPTPLDLNLRPGRDAEHARPSHRRERDRRAAASVRA